MTAPRTRLLAAAGMRGPLLAALALCAPAALHAGSGTDDGLARCRAIGADAQRLACYDALAGRAPPPSPPAPALPAAAGAPAAAPAATTAVAAAATAAGASPGPAAPAAAPAPTPEELFGLDPARSDARVRDAAGIGRVEELPLRVAEVRRDATGKAVLGFDNGQAWAQLDTTPVRLAPGDAVVIRRAAFGSYLLMPATGNRSIRVRRIR